jgi:hypothetical protein
MTMTDIQDTKPLDDFANLLESYESLLSIYQDSEYFGKSRDPFYTLVSQLTSDFRVLLDKYNHSDLLS